MIADTVGFVHDALEVGQHVLLEGAQATFLDLDHGTYPFVTSSNPVAGGACTGSGVGPLAHRPGHRDRQGVCAPGSGRARSRPSSLDDIGDLLVERGHEFGTNTGRRRRTGWFDAVMLRHAVRLNSLTEVAITKLDVLDVLDSVKVCVAYELDGRALRALARTTSRSCTRSRRSTRSCPVGAPTCRRPPSRTTCPRPPATTSSSCRQQVGVPIRLVGVGPGREQFVHFAA